MAMQLKASQMKQFLIAAIQRREPVCIIGQPGVYKTEVCRQVGAELNYDLIISHPALEDPTDGKGIPFTGKDGTVDFQPIGQVKKVLEATRPTIWLIDDFGQAIPSVQATYMQWLHGGECAGHKLPACVTMILCTNRRGDRAGVSGILTPISSRVTYVEAVADVEEWCNYMLTLKEIDGVEIPAEVMAEQVAFMRYRPALLSDFDPSADMENCPLPRNWTKVTKWLAGGLSDAMIHVALAGRVGAGAAGERMAFRKLVATLPTLDKILSDPTSVAIPDNAGQLYALMTGLASRANTKTAVAVAKFAQRVVDARKGEFAVLLIRDVLRREPKVAETPAFVRLLTGDLKHLVSGAD